MVVSGRSHLYTLGNVFGAVGGLGSEVMLTPGTKGISWQEQQHNFWIRASSNEFDNSDLPQSDRAKSSTLLNPTWE